MYINGKEINTDKEGYLLDFNDWDEELAYAIAQQDDIVLTPSHFEIIYFLQNFYFEYQTTPAMRMLTKLVKKKIGEEKGSSMYLFQLFPKGPAKQGCKIAGLPKPAKCL